jgi:subtilisin-like proprotein convertase family protein
MMKLVSVFLGAVALVSTAFVRPVAAQTAVSTFTNATPLTIPSSGPASVYPSTIAVSGVTGVTYGVTLTMNITHTFPADVDILLVDPGGRSTMIVGDIGAGTDWNNTVLSFNDCAPRALASGAIGSGRYRPTNLGGGDPFPAPAPTGVTGVGMSEFNWVSPNGTWSLYVVDDLAGFTGFISAWNLTFHTQPASPQPRPTGLNPQGCTAPDYDGDGRTDVAVYRPTSGEWFISQSGQGGAVRQLAWGAPSSSGLGDTATPADYDGDGVTDVAIYRAATGDWIIARSSDSGVSQIAFGAPSSLGLGDTPVPGDYDGDGQADLAIFRTNTGEWFLRSSAGIGVQQFLFGYPPFGDRPAR